MTTPDSQPEKDPYEGPQSKLERQYIDEYLKSQGYLWAELIRLPEAEAKRLMILACRFAATRLAEHEAQAKLRKNIRIG